MHTPLSIDALWGAAAPEPPGPHRPMQGDAATGHEFRLHTEDGAELAATAHEPAGAARAVALIAPATAVPRQFYRPFAQWLAGRGYAVLTIDYRGIAGSRGAGLAPPSISMRDWMQRDLPAALAAACHRAGHAPAGAARLPILWVGHSLGGHALAQLPGIEQVDAAIGVAAQLPSYAHWPSAVQRLGARVFFNLWVPGLVRLFGRLPGWALGGGEDLPAAAALDWCHWGRMDNYFASDPQVALTTGQWQGRAHFWCITDDWIFGPQGAVAALQRTFDGAAGQAELHRMSPADLGLRRLGHFGPFRRSVGPKAWPIWLDRIEAATPALQPVRA